MKAVALYKYLPIDHEESFVNVVIDTPVPTGRDLLVRVKAVSVNPVDTKVRAPKDTIETQPKILGWDASGIVEAVGSDTSLFAVGDEVYYAGVITRPGCNSEFHLVDERIVGRKPRTLSFDEAAAMPLTTITAWEALFDRLGIAPQKTAANQASTVLVIGGSGGVGSITIQLAKQVAGLRVIATASREASAQWCRDMGADDVINHHRPLREELKNIGVDEVDFILCYNSTEQYIQGMADMIKPQGKICAIVSTKNNQPINMNLFQAKSVTFCWELMFTRPMFNTPDMQAQHTLLNKAAQLLEEGVLRTTMTEQYGVLTADNLRRAHARIESGTMIGKAVLSGIE